MVEVYGKTGCADTQMSRDLLDRASVSYTWLDVEKDPSMVEQAMAINGGVNKWPTIAVGGDVLIEPSALELRQALARDQQFTVNSESTLRVPATVAGPPKSHMDHALRRLREEMERRGMDALVAVGAENAYYASGWASPSAYRHGGTGLTACVVFKDEAAGRVLIESEYWAPSAPRYDDLELLTYPTFIFIGNPHDLPGVSLDPNLSPEPSLEAATAQILAALGRDPSCRVVGIDRHFLRVDSWEGLNESGKYQFVDATGAFFAARARKSAWEIERIMEAHDITENGVRHCLGLLEDGISSHDLQREFTRFCFSDPRTTDVRFSQILIAPDFAPSYFPARELPLERGRIVKFDLGAEVRGYGADIARTFAFGEPDAATARIYDAMHAANEAVMQGLEIGRPMSDLFREGISAARGKGIPTYDRGHVGHSVGLARAVEEWPQVSASAESVIEPGMVLSLETPYHGYGVGGINIEDMVVVEEGGIRVLTTLSKDLAGGAA